jgi:hypothetical protein
MTRKKRTPSDVTSVDPAREEYIRRLVAAAPPLTEEQKHRLSVLLNAGRV